MYHSVVSCSSNHEKENKKTFTWSLDCKNEGKVMPYACLVVLGIKMAPINNAIIPMSHQARTTYLDYSEFTEFIASTTSVI
jgi:hypothetical protein